MGLGDSTKSSRPRNERKVEALPACKSPLTDLMYATLFKWALHKQWNLRTEILSVVNEEAKLCKAQPPYQTEKFCVKMGCLTLSDSLSEISIGQG